MQPVDSLTGPQFAWFGQPVAYTGRSMKASHAGVGITEADWTATVNYLVATRDKFKVPEKEKGELIGLLATMKGDVIEKP